MRFTGRGSVWDNDKKRSLCKFDVKGILDTEDEYVIKKLLALGYEEADESEMVSIYECNAVNVDWKERYSTEHEKLVALRRKYVEIEEQLRDIQENTKMDVAPPSVDIAEEEAVAEISDDYIIGDIVVPRDFASLPIVQLKKLLKQLDGLQGKDYRMVTKDDAIIMMGQLLEQKGIE